MDECLPLNHRIDGISEIGFLTHFPQLIWVPKPNFWRICKRAAGSVSCRLILLAGFSFDTSTAWNQKWHGWRPDLFSRGPNAIAAAAEEERRRGSSASFGAAAAAAAALAWAFGSAAEESVPAPLPEESPPWACPWEQPAQLFTSFLCFGPVSPR